MVTTYLIIGAGIAGLNLAIGLQKRNIPFLICEAAPFVKGIGAGFGLAANAMKAFEYLGIENEVTAIGKPLKGLQVLDAKANAIIAGTPRSISADYTQNYAIHRADLHQLLLHKIDSAYILTNHKLVDIHIQHKTAVFENGSKIAFTFLIGADGIHSEVRQKIFPDSSLRYSGYTCWRAVVKDDMAQMFESFETWGKKGRFGMTPLTDNRIYWYACINTPLYETKVRNYTISDLQNNFATYHQQIQKVLKVTQPQQLMRHDLFDLKPLKKYTQGNILLIGDAAHATTPNLGQGAGMAVEDVATLLFLIDKGFDFTKIAALYNKSRVSRCKNIVQKSNILGKIAQLNNPLLIPIRNFMFRNMPTAINHRQMQSILQFSLMPNN